MSPTETDQINPTTPVRSRWPHIVGVIAGIALLAGIILLWTGSTPDSESSERSALGSTMSVGNAGKSSQVPLPIGLPNIASPSSVGIQRKTKSADKSQQTTETAAVAPDSTNGAFEKAILGTWKQYSYGHRLLKVLDDGTATIDVKLDGLYALTLGEKMHFDIEWKIEDDTLVFKTVGGTPESSINTVQSIYGDNRVYRILEINEKQMLLQEDEEKKTPWDRVTEEESPEKAKSSR
ncbi:MAG: hypothetical protein HON53_24475 [Planctomycetaceae bacterium]|nr:hypothetical protein [Planctomycetaceae bacterium]MBT6154493.1 hypothetical protein [Planctomycetaceae bacterium]MBT6486523.1 hypothetical protein [Planctomycetaceae bacterium]MBT6497950.1 hypothetical protein [Planctomycetaceae bacterium]